MRGIILVTLTFLIISESGTREAIASPGGNEWARLDPVASPVAQDGHAMAYDSGSDRVILFGRGETWAYDLNTNLWQNRNPIFPPSDRAWPSIAYDSRSDRIILFGGLLASVSNETWAYDFKTNTWQDRNPPTRPVSRYGHAMAYDSESDRVILFGGSQGGDETWAYDFDRNQWNAMNPSTRPSARSFAAMAYDSESDRVILFGGGQIQPLSDETWAYDFNSNNWLNMSPSIRPIARDLHTMAYDSRSDRSIIFGGQTYPPSNETWAYDFNTNQWMNLDAPTKPSARWLHAMAYDSESDRTILFGGDVQPASESEQTWAYHLPNPPDAPQNLQAFAGDSQVRLDWQPPRSDGDSLIANYRIYRGTVSANLVFITEVNNVFTFLDMNLTNGQAYFYRVTAKNAMGEGLPSAEASATPMTPLSLPLMVITPLALVFGISILITRYKGKARGASARA